MTDSLPQDLASLKADLAWYLAMGVDNFVTEKAQDWTKVEASALEVLPRAAAINPSPGATKPAAERRSGHDRVAAPALASLAGNQSELVKKANQSAGAAADLAALNASLEAFEGCSLKTTARSLVFADGNPEADLMMIGEAPGRDEDLQGLPFVGRSGQLLDRMIAAIGRTREQVYITNLLPWRPPGNRTPSPEEVAMLRPFVERHIALVKPKVIMFLGAAAAQALTGRKEGIKRMRGQWLNYQLGEMHFPALATFHPAFLLRQPLSKRESWHDLLMVKQKLDEGVSTPPDE